MSDGSVWTQHNMTRIVILLFVMTMLLGCTDTDKNGIVSEDSLATGASAKYLYGTTVLRIVDLEAGAVCWIYNGYQEGGIFCLPVSLTEFADD